MISTSGPTGSLNADLCVHKSLIEFVQTADISELEALKYNWNRNSLKSGSSAFQILDNSGFIEMSETKAKLSRGGRLFLSRILIQFSQVEEGEEQVLNNTYYLKKRKRVGKNSAIYLAEHKILGTKVIVKILRPGASENIEYSLKLMSRLDARSGIVRPNDFFTIIKEDIFGNPVKLKCVIYPEVKGISLREFLSQENYHLNSHIAMSFVRQVGFTLAELEKLGAYHGDLHDENILVEEIEDYQLRFTLIDVSFGAMGSQSAEECKNSDLSHFRQHMWRMLALQKSFLPRMSLRKFLGTSQFKKINSIISGDFKSFSEIMEVTYGTVEQKNFEYKKNQFIAEKFYQPTTFRLQRYEEIIDPSAAAKLFVPFPELMSKVKDFSNTFVSGNRGSGKSTYLAALGFFPHSSESHVDFRKIFGVYFPCRQGEFKSLRGHMDWNSDELQEFTTHIMIVKIIRRTLESISDGSKLNRILVPDSLDELRSFLNKFVPFPGIVSVENDLLPELENFASTMVRIEMELLILPQKKFNKNWTHLGLNSLIDFFNAVKNTFKELSSSRFHVLFDDAGSPNLSSNVQKVLCDLILTSNSVFCVKFSAEKFTFKFVSSFEKIPESGHDYFEHDISQMLFVGSGNARLPRKELEKYFRRIVNQRLEYFNYSSKDIIAYLGDNPNISDQLIGLLAASRRNAKYAGWTAVWNIAERTPRNLLEIVSEIFAYGEIEPKSSVQEISLSVQDKAIRAISHKRLISLSQVAGYITMGGQKFGLGRKLYEVTASLGSVFRIYLREEQGKQRKRQHLSLERNDSSELTSDASEILEKLISFGVLDDSKVEYARDDGVLKPIYVLNRIFCPAFNIIYRRDEHLRLSRKRFELLLLDPESFVKTGTRRLTKYQTEGTIKNDLFGFSIYE